MAKTIGNPLSWTARNLAATGHHIAATTLEVGGAAKMNAPVVRALTGDDLHAALRAGWRDFLASRTDAAFAVLVYPAAGIALFALGLHLALFRALPQLSSLTPVLAGVSRKSMLGAITGQPVEARVVASAVAAALAVQLGAVCVRVHDVAATRDALAVLDAVRS